MVSRPRERQRATQPQAVRLVLTDCDGVLTDAGVYYSAEGEELKRFSRRDGMGMERLRTLAGIETGIVTREESAITARRAERLGVRELHLGVRDKLPLIEEIAARRGLTLAEVAYVGDDVNDADALGAVGFSACPSDAEPFIRERVDYVCTRRGGHGAFREVAELILTAQQRTSVVAASAPAGSIIRLVRDAPRRWVSAGSRAIGDGEPVYIIAEIGINHNGSVDIAKKLIDGAVAAGCDCVKFQKRTPELCVPPEQQHLERDTPWGRLTYLEYRRKVELNFAQYAEIDRYCKERGIAWTASCWDEPSVDFLAAFDPPLLKAASASLTDHDLLRKMQATGKPLMLSTGMSTLEEIDAAVQAIGSDRLLIAHSTSTYPCPPRELNLRTVATLRERYDGVPIGYSGHETGLATTYAAIALGAAFVERHITLDRSMWGSDQAASVEIVGLVRLVRDVRTIEESLGDGVKRVFQSELGALKRLRRVAAPPPAVASSGAPA
ncbi:MAG TPA: N-acetylneuraminate synthase family protein [Gemmatimonadales bacterium]|nr:N-acetylneuraminate synthase family protein [Gemmatimonadales bacterium]